MADNLNVISTVVSQLEEQEKNLLNQLDKIQKAKALLIGEPSPTPAKTGKKRGPKPGSKRGRKPGPKPGSKRKSGRVTYFDQITSLLSKSKTPMKPNDIIKKLFDCGFRKNFTNVLVMT